MAGESAHQIWAEGLTALDTALRALETKGAAARSPSASAPRAKCRSSNHALSTGTSHGRPLHGKKR